MKYSDNNKLDCLIRLAYMNCGENDIKLFDSTDGTEQPIPKRLDAKIRRLIKRGGRVDIYATTKKIFVRIAIAAMLVMSILFALFVSVSGIREAIWKAIVEWYDDYITIHYEVEAPEADSQTPEDSAPVKEEDSANAKEDESVSENEDESSSESDTSSSSEDTTPPAAPTPPTKIEEIRKPSYVLDGVFEDVLTSKTGVLVDYISGNNVVYSFSQYVMDENKTYVDNETATVQQISINSYVASLVTYENNAETSIIWNDGEYVYIVFSSVIDVDEMIKIAESVRAE